MHRNHVAPCVIAVALGLALLLVSGVSLAGATTLVVLLLCPLAMVVMMATMGGHGGHSDGKGS